MTKNILQIDDIIQHNFTLYNHIRQQNESFAEFCVNYCKLNEPLRNFYVRKNATCGALKAKKIDLLRFVGRL